jgi:hypothetical protein
VVGPVFALGLDPSVLVTGTALEELHKPPLVLPAAWAEGAVEGGMSGSPIVTAEGMAVSLVTRTIGDPDQSSDDTRDPLLAARLPAWLVPKRSRKRRRGLWTHKRDEWLRHIE